MALINPDTLNLSEQVVRTNKVQKTHKGGRTMSWNVLIVVGDGEGHVGCGIGKARAIPDAIRKGVEAARKNIVKVPMVGSTIPHEVLSRISAAKVMLRPAAPGTGVVAGGSIRSILEAAGVRDVLAKSLGSSNPINSAWATMDALRQLKRATDIARLRGKNVLDLVSKRVAAESGYDLGFVPSTDGTHLTDTASTEGESTETVVEASSPLTDAEPITEHVPAIDSTGITAAEGTADVLTVAEPVVDEKPKRASKAKKTDGADEPATEASVDVATEPNLAAEAPVEGANPEEANPSA